MALDTIDQPLIQSASGTWIESKLQDAESRVHQRAKKITSQPSSTVFGIGNGHIRCHGSDSTQRMPIRSTLVLLDSSQFWPSRFWSTHCRWDKDFFLARKNRWNSSSSTNSNQTRRVEQMFHILVFVCLQVMFYFPYGSIFPNQGKMSSLPIPGFRRSQDIHPRPRPRPAPVRQRPNRKAVGWRSLRRRWECTGRIVSRRAPRAHRCASQGRCFGGMDRSMRSFLRCFWSSRSGQALWSNPKTSLGTGTAVCAAPKPADSSRANRDSFPLWDPQDGGEGKTR